MEAYPLQNGPSVTNIEIGARLDKPVIVNRLRQVQRSGPDRHYWLFSLRYRRRRFAEMDIVQNFLDRHRHGMAFLLTLPGETNYPPLRVTQAAANADQVTLQPISVQQAGDLAGQFVQFAGHDKSYLITDYDASSGAMTLAPPLYADVANGAQATAPTFRVRLARPDVKWPSQGSGARLDLRVELIEDWG